MKISKRALSIPVASILFASILLASIVVAGCVNKSVSDPTTDSAPGNLHGKVSRGPLSPMGGGPVSGASSGGEVTDARLDITAATTGKLAATARTDASGRYSVSLAPGTYTVTMPTPQGALFSRDLPATVTIVAGQPAVLDIHLDTGIR